MIGRVRLPCGCEGYDLRKPTVEVLVEIDKPCRQHRTRTIVVRESQIAWRDEKLEWAAKIWEEMGPLNRGGAGD